MRLSEEQVNGFTEAAKPLVKWLNENGHPHTKIVLDCTGAELVEGIASVRIEEFLKD